MAGGVSEAADAQRRPGPKGRTGPKVVDGLRVEGNRPEELFDANGRFMPELAELVPWRTANRTEGSVRRPGRGGE